LKLLIEARSVSLRRTSPLEAFRAFVVWHSSWTWRSASVIGALLSSPGAARMRAAIGNMDRDSLCSPPGAGAGAAKIGAATRESGLPALARIGPLRFLL